MSNSNILFSSTFSNNADTLYRIPLITDYTWYFAPVQVGTPPQLFNLMLDTGSSLTWIQTTDCQHDPFSPPTCNHAQKFNSSSSATFVSIEPEDVVMASYTEGTVKTILVQDKFTIGLPYLQQPIPFSLHSPNFTASGYGGDGGGGGGQDDDKDHQKNNTNFNQSSQSRTSTTSVPPALMTSQKPPALPSLVQTFGITSDISNENFLLHTETAVTGFLGASLRSFERSTGHSTHLFADIVTSLPSPIFGTAFSETWGTLTLGGPDPSFYTQPITWLKALPCEKGWATNLDALIELGVGPLTLSSKSANTSQGVPKASISTGTDQEIQSQSVDIGDSDEALKENRGPELSTKDIERLLAVGGDYSDQNTQALKRSVKAKDGSSPVEEMLRSTLSKAAGFGAIAAGQSQSQPNRPYSQVFTSLDQVMFDSGTTFIWGDSATVKQINSWIGVHEGSPYGEVSCSVIPSLGNIVFTVSGATLLPSSPGNSEGDSPALHENPKEGEEDEAENKMRIELTPAQYIIGSSHSKECFSSFHSSSEGKRRWIFGLQVLRAYYTVYHYRYDLIGVVPYNITKINPIEALFIPGIDGQIEKSIQSNIKAPPVGSSATIAAVSLTGRGAFVLSLGILMMLTLY